MTFFFSKLGNEQSHSNCFLFSVYHHNVPVHFGSAAALHGLPDSPGAHVEEAPVWALAAYTERR